jgi:hypothetical protein
LIEPANINRLYRDQHSGDGVLVLEGKNSLDEVKVVIPGREATCLALEAHGFSDRCDLYSILTFCVERLGGAFGGVVVKLDESAGATVYLTLIKDGVQDWLRGHVAELIAFPLHVRLPIYLARSDAGALQSDNAYEAEREDSSSSLSVFDRVLAEIMETRPSEDFEE